MVCGPMSLHTPSLPPLPPSPPTPCPCAHTSRVLCWQLNSAPLPSYAPPALPCPALAPLPPPLCWLSLTHPGWISGYLFVNMFLKCTTSNMLWLKSLDSLRPGGWPLRKHLVVRLVQGGGHTTHNTHKKTSTHGLGHSERTPAWCKHISHPCTCGPCQAISHAM